MAPVDVTEEFFAGIAGREDPALRKATGTVRFELSHDDAIEHWLVVIDKGMVRAFRAPEAIECESVIRADKTLFEEITRGEANTTTAMLRGVVSVEGDLELLLLFQRLIGRP
jgi:putative sterol carrier protein